MPIPIIISAILAAAKLGKAAYDAKSKNDTNFLQQTMDQQKKASEGTGQLMNRYFKDDLVKYMSFLKQNMTQ